MIVGAGPAGSSAAIRLSQAGRHVLLIDKAEFPRHKLCGEFVSPECLDHLEDLGIAPQIEAASPESIHKTVFYSSGGRSFSVASRWLSTSGVNSIGLSRRALDQALLNRAVSVGAIVLTKTSIAQLNQSDGPIHRLTLRSSDSMTREVSTPMLIDSTGRGRYIARRFDEPRTSPKPARVGFKGHFRGAAIERASCEIFSYPSGYGGCSQVENGLFNLCFIVDAELVRRVGNDPIKVLEESVLKNRRASEVLADIEIEGEWLSVPIARYGSLDPAPAPSVLAIGDAAAFIDPFTGSGIAMALQSSQIACSAIASGGSQETIADMYRQAHYEAFGRRLAFCRVLRSLSSVPRLADAIIIGLSTSEHVRRLFARATRSFTSEQAVTNDR